MSAPTPDLAVLSLPWRVEPSEESPYDREVLNAEDDLIAIVVHDRFLPDPERDVIARSKFLALAAGSYGPLVEILEETSAGLESYLESYGDHDGELGGILGAVNAVLAAARGEGA